MTGAEASPHASPVGIFTVDTQLVVTTWDPWMASATGIPARAALGQSVLAIVPDAEERGVLARMRAVLARGTVEILSPALHQYLIPCASRTASTRFARMQQHVSMGPLREDGAITGVVITVEDVTARMTRDRVLADSVEAMTAALGDPDFGARQRGVKRLSVQGDAIVGMLIQTLREQHRNFSVLSSALDLLAIADLDVVDPLIECLGSDDADLRVQAALVLGERRDRRSVPALMRALEDEDVNVRFHAIEALGRLDATEAVDALLAIAESADFFLAFPAIQALARLGDADVARRLLPLLGDELVGAAAVDALGELGDDTVAEPLAARLAEPRAPVEAIADALTLLFHRYEQRYGAGERIATIVRRTAAPAAIRQLLAAVDRVGSDRLRGIATVLGWLDGPAVERALARLLGQPSVRAQIVEAIVRHGAGVVDLLVEQLDAEDLETRQAAAIALGRIGDRRATAALVAALDDRELAVPAATALSRIGDAAAFEGLMARLGDPDPSVRQGVIAALNSIGHAEMPRRVMTLLDDADDRVRESAVKIAGYFGYRECLEAVLRRTSDSSEAVRRAAVEQLPMFDDERATAALSEALASGTPPVRAAAAAAFARIEGPAAVAALLSALDDEDGWVRYFALRSLASCADAGAASPVREKLRHDPAPHVRLAAIEALGRIDPVSTFPLLAPLTQSADADTARAAIRAMRHADVPEAPAHLDMLSRAPEEWRRAEAVAALGHRGGTDAVASLQWVAAGDESEAVADAALAGLTAIAARDDPDGSGAARAIVALTAEPARREAAVSALARLPVSRAADVASGLQHASPAVRRASVEALSRMRHVDATRWIERALDDAAPSVRAAAVAELRRLGSRRAGRKLVMLAQSDPDPGVRHAALIASDSGAGG